jgi:hypothetical protein
VQTVTVNSIRDGVISALDAAFPTIPISGEEIKQNLNPPCFFVKLLTGSQTALLGRRRRRSNSVDIHYFAVGDANRLMHEMAENLYKDLELIDIEGKKYRGTNMTHEIVDEVLHFFVDYNFHVLRDVAEDPSMQTMAQEGFIK